MGRRYVVRHRDLFR